jgi:hypothetical protein
MPFPDLTHVTIVRPSRRSTNETRITVNLLNSTNGIDGSKDVPLEFGDRVEIPEREYSLGENRVLLTGTQRSALLNFLKGNVQLIVRQQKLELPLFPVAEGSTVRAILDNQEAQKVLRSSSDLSRVKVTRRDPATGKKHEWILDCHDLNLAPDLWLHDGDVIEVPEK